MLTNIKTLLKLIVVLLILTVFSSCSSGPTTSDDPATTPTPTEVIQVAPPTQTETPSICEGLLGELEIQILVGPAEVVGLEPHSVGFIPFSVTTDEPPFLIQGGGNFDYGDILVEEWGTYEVTMSMSGTVNGTCIADEAGGELALSLELTGSQLVVVSAEGFSGEYPWEGTQSFDLVFPIEEGASMDGEGYVIILHMK